MRWINGIQQKATTTSKGYEGDDCVFGGGPILRCQGGNDFCTLKHDKQKDNSIRLEGISTSNINISFSEKYYIYQVLVPKRMTVR